MESRQNCHGSRAGHGFSVISFERGNKSVMTFDYSNYPEDLVWQVLGRLPLRSLLSCRCVSREWNSLVKDPQFQKFWANVHSGGPFLFYHEFMKLVLANTKDHNVTAFDGFLHLGMNRGEDRYVIDPANVYLKKIPRLPVEVSSPPGTPGGSWCYEWAAGMAVSPGIKVRTYSILVASLKYSMDHRGSSFREDPYSVYQYDSTTDAWHLACTFPFSGVEWNRLLRSVVMHQGSLYSLSDVSHNSQWREGQDYNSFEVARYKEQYGCWEYLTSGFPALSGFDSCRPLLFEHNGKLLLASLCSGSYCIWQYHDDAREWSLLEIFPQKLTAGLDAVTSKASQFSFSAQNCGSFLYVAKWSSVDCEMPFVMTYNLVNSQYKEMPSDEVEYKLVQFWREKCFFHPAR